jgi:hypothetical protein
MDVEEVALEGADQVDNAPGTLDGGLKRLRSREVGTDEVELPHGREWLQEEGVPRRSLRHPHPGAGLEQGLADVAAVKPPPRRP